MEPAPVQFGRHSTPERLIFQESKNGTEPKHGRGYTWDSNASAVPASSGLIILCTYFHDGGVECERVGHAERRPWRLHASMPARWRRLLPSDIFSQYVRVALP